MSSILVGFFYKNNGLRLCNDVPVGRCFHETRDSWENVVRGNVKPRSPVRQQKHGSGKMDHVPGGGGAFRKSCVCSVVFARIGVVWYWLLEMPPS